MSYRRFLAALVVLLMVLTVALAGCSGNKSTGNSSSGGSKGDKAGSAATKYPEKPVTIVIGFGAGGGVDTASRGIQPYLQKYLGGTVLVENKPGNNALIATNYVGQAKSDGYTLLAGTNGMALMSSLYADSYKLGKPLQEALIPIYSWVNADGNGILVKKDSPFKTIDDLAAEAKKRSVKMAIAGGMGSTDQVTVLMLQKVYGGQWTIIPMESASEVAAAVQGGKVDAGSGSPASASMDPAQLRMLAVTMEKRSTRWPDTPTFAELGKPELTIIFVVGIMAPAGTPPEIVQKVADAFDKARNDPEFVAWAQKTNQPIGTEGWKADKFKNYLKTYQDNMQKILPDLQAQIKAAQGAKK